MIVPKNTKDILCESLRELAASQPFKAITVKQVCENCNVTTRTFYNYFRDKNDMIDWMYVKMVEDCTRRTGDIVNWPSSMSNLLNCIYNRIDFIKKVNAYQGQNSLFSIMYEHMQQKYIAYARLMEAPAVLDKDVEFAIKFFNRGCCIQIDSWISNITECTPEVLLRRLQLCVPGVALKYFS